MDRRICWILTLLTLGIYSLASAAIVTNDECDNEWLAFGLKFGKSYKNQYENSMRKRIFCKNLEFVRDKNNESGREDFGINSKSDWTQEELNKLRMKPSVLRQIRDSKVLSINKAQLNDYLKKIKSNLTAPFVPNTVFWHENPRVVGPVKNQGPCGSCWAFSAVGLIEANEHKWDDKITEVTPLSEQQLLDCGPYDEPCHSGLVDEALYYIKQTGGLMAESDYPYLSGVTEAKHKCRLYQGAIFGPTRRMNYFARLEGADEQVLKRIVALYGPISVGIYADDNFNQLREHVHKGPDFVSNHAVLLVGYGTTDWGEDYWLIKNSWGDDWGVDGFGKIARNQNNSCAITSYPVMLI